MGTRKPTVMNIENDVIFGRVYKIYNIIDDEVYIGSTIQTLVQRWSEHLYQYRTEKRIMRVYSHFKKIGIENFRMKLLDAKVVENIKELRGLEQKWINKENPKNLLNSYASSAKYQEMCEIIKPIIEELINKVFEIKLDNINE
jgi:group I intron endonuclease